MTRVVLCGSLIVGLMLGVGCTPERTASSALPAPTAPSTVPVAPITPPPQRLPPGELVATYVFSGPLNFPIFSATTGSEYLLYDTGAFGLRYDTFSHVYLGTYRQEGATITFWFDGQWTWNQGIATGTLNGDLLEVRYSDIMVHSDFENAVYRRSR